MTAEGTMHWQRERPDADNVDCGCLTLAIGYTVCKLAPGGLAAKFAHVNDQLTHELRQRTRRIGLWLVTRDESVSEKTWVKLKIRQNMRNRDLYISIGK